MADPTFGIGITRADAEARPATFGDLSVVGLVGTAPNAVAEVFPYNKPVFLYSDDATKLLQLGDGGTLQDAIKLMNDQLGEFQVAAQVVVVRVEAGANATATIDKILGDGMTTGIHALKAAGPEFGKTPRLIGVPGFTSQRETGVASIAVTAGGTGYATAPTVTFTGGGGTGPIGVAVLGTGANAGKVVAVNVIKGGSNFTTAPTIAFTGGGGTGAAATATVADLGNPVCAALPAVLDRLLAHAVVDGPATTETAAKSWRETLNSERLIPVDPAVIVRADGENVVIPSSPAVLGIAVRRDHEFGGRPFHSWANQAVRGIIGTSRNVPFSMTDGATEGQSLLAANIGVIVRGEMGVDGAIGDGGFVYLGTDNTGSDELWRFYNQTRGRDYIHIGLLRTVRYYLGRYNITSNTVEAIKRTVEFMLRDLQATGDILGYKVEFKRDQNSPEQLRLGRLKISFKAEEAPVLRYLGLTSGRYSEALDVLLDDLVAQANA